jgi:hypothetical protein
MPCQPGIVVIFPLGAPAPARPRPPRLWRYVSRRGDRLAEKPARKAEHTRLHASTTGKVIFGQAGDGSDGQGNIQYDNTPYEGHADINGWMCC